MKNLINYYYNLSVENFKKINDVFVFNIKKEIYEFVPFLGNIDEFLKIYSSIIKNNKYCHEVVFNKKGQILTFYNNTSYILLKKKICINKKVDINEIINYDIQVFLNKKFTWKTFWEKKIDYYEYQMSQLGVKYPLLRNSLPYYVGLSENAIAILNYVNENDIRYYISHKRIKVNEKLDSFFNPVNFVVDTRVRDIAEYIKDSFFSEENIKIDCFNWLRNLELNFTEELLFLARLLYPTYYFDLYDQIIQGKMSENAIENFTQKNCLYEQFVKKVYQNIKVKYNFFEIEWLNK